MKAPRAAKPKIGQRVRWEPTGDLGTIIQVSPSAKRVQVEWDRPDPDSGAETSQHDIAPHVSLTLLEKVEGISEARLEEIELEGTDPGDD